MKLRFCRIPRPRVNWPVTPAKYALWIMLAWLAAAGVSLFIHIPWP